MTWGQDRLTFQRGGSLESVEGANFSTPEPTESQAHNPIAQPIRAELSNDGPRYKLPHLGQPFQVGEPSPGWRHYRH